MAIQCDAPETGERARVAHDFCEQVARVAREDRASAAARRGKGDGPVEIDRWRAAKRGEFRTLDGDDPECACQRPVSPDFIATISASGP